jgi:hypothetical protein
MMLQALPPCNLVYPVFKDFPSRPSHPWPTPDCQLQNAVLKKAFRKRLEFPYG